MHISSCSIETRRISIVSSSRHPFGKSPLRLADTKEPLKLPCVCKPAKSSGQLQVNNLKCDAMLRASDLSEARSSLLPSQATRHCWRCRSAMTSRPVLLERQRRVLQSAASAENVPLTSAGSPEAAEHGEASTSPEAALLEKQRDSQQKPGLWARVKGFFVGEKWDRKRLAALGLGAIASYGFVSNATYGTGMAISWVAFVRKTGKSPLMPGQWKTFLAFFAGFWTVQHFLRPLRFTVAIAMAPAFDRMLMFLQQATGWSKRNAFGLYLVIFGSLTCFLVFGSIFVFAGPMAFARA